MAPNDDDGLVEDGVSVFNALPRGAGDRENGAFDGRVRTYCDRDIDLAGQSYADRRVPMSKPESKR